MAPGWGAVLWKFACGLGSGTFSLFDVVVIGFDFRWLWYVFVLL